LYKEKEGVKFSVGVYSNFIPFKKKKEKRERDKRREGIKE